MFSLGQKRAIGTVLPELIRAIKSTIAPFPSVEQREICAALVRELGGETGFEINGPNDGRGKSP